MKKIYSMRFISGLLCGQSIGIFKNRRWCNTSSSNMFSAQRHFKWNLQRNIASSKSVSCFPLDMAASISELIHTLVLFQSKTGFQVVKDLFPYKTQLNHLMFHGELWCNVPLLCNFPSSSFPLNGRFLFLKTIFIKFRSHFSSFSGLLRF